MTDGLGPSYVINSNILLRISRRDDADHAVVDRAMFTRNGEDLSSGIFVLRVNLYDARLVAAMAVHKVVHS